MKYQIVYGKTLDDYMKEFGDAYNSGDLWDFSLADVITGAIDSTGQTYWEINGRLYETKFILM